MHSKKVFKTETKETKDKTIHFEIKPVVCK